MNAITLVAPWALAGLLLVGLPIAIHLVGRAPARPFKFPSLRFVAPSQLLPRRRARIEDPLLLLLRVAAIAAAAVALAAPAFRGAVSGAASGAVATVVVVDTTASVVGAAGAAGVASATGAAAIVELTRIADSAVAASDAGTVVRTASPARELAGAASWLARHDAQREIVLVSDFQVGSVDSADIAVLPAGIRVHFRRVASRPVAAIAAVQGGAAVEASAASVTKGVEATWTRRGAAPRDSALRILSGDADRALAAALIDASRTSGVGASNAATGPIAVVLPSSDSAAALGSSAQPITADWQRRVVAALASDRLLFSLAPAATAPFRAASDHDGRRLLLFVPQGANPEAALNLVSGIRRAAARASAAGASAAGELMPRTVDDATLARWSASRTVSTAPAAAAGQPPLHGPATRWLWIAALLLLAVEWVLRRAAHRPSQRTADATR